MSTKDDCVCKELKITAAPVGTESVSVTVVQGGPARIRVTGPEISELWREAVDGETVLIEGLKSDSTYQVWARNDACCTEDSAAVSTMACPPVTLVTTASTPQSITVQMPTGGPAMVSILGTDQQSYMAAGAAHTFTGLEPDRSYTFRAVSDCGVQGTFNFSTPSCPVIDLALTSATPTSMTVHLNAGGPATVVVVGTDQQSYMTDGGTATFSGLVPAHTYAVKVTSDCGNSVPFNFSTIACPDVTLTATALSTTSASATVTAGGPATVSVISSSGVVLDSKDNVSGTVTFVDLPEGEAVAFSAVNECGKKTRVNVNLPDAPKGPCPTLSLANASPFFKGFAFAPGDVADPAATVAYRGGWIYPTPGEGHTVKVVDTDGVTVLGYAVNKSDCANPCCDPAANRNNVGDTIIDDSVDNYYVKGEVNKCDGSPILPDDRIFNVGSLQKCVNGEVVPLECGDIVKVVPNCNATECNTAVRMTAPTAIVGAGICVDVQANGFDNGIAVLRGRDLVSELGSVAQGGSTGAHLPYTHTNTSNCPQLFVARLVANGNIARWAPAGTRLSFVYNVGPVLGINMPTTASNPLLPNFATMRQTIFAAASNTRGATPGINEYQESTVTGARHIQVLQPGESTTIYAQWWAVLYEDTQLPALTPIHGHMGLDITVYENGAYL